MPQIKFFQNPVALTSPTVFKNNPTGPVKSQQILSPPERQVPGGAWGCPRRTDPGGGVPGNPSKGQIFPSALLRRNFWAYFDKNFAQDSSQNGLFGDLAGKIFEFSVLRLCRAANWSPGARRCTGWGMSPPHPPGGFQPPPEYIPNIYRPPSLRDRREGSDGGGGGCQCPVAPRWGRAACPQRPRHAELLPHGQVPGPGHRRPGAALRAAATAADWHPPPHSPVTPLAQ